MKISIRHVITLFTALTLFSTAVFAQEEAFKEGVQYETLTEIQPVSTGDKIEVLELFWYRCPHCNALEVPLQKWIKQGKPENAEYVPFPAVLSSRWETGARIFYTLEALNLLDDLHGKMFYAIHSEHRRFNTAEDLAKWVEEQGYNGQDILNTYDSFAVNTKVSYAKTMTRKYGIEGVPSIIVDGKYRTSVSQAGDYDSLFKVINFLVAKAAAERN